jgi:hypothetical protein
MTTIADMLDTSQLSTMMSLALQANVPAEAAVPDPVRLVDAVCACGAKLKIAEPIVGEPTCIDCAKNRVLGKAGRRYVKTNHPVRVQATPEELAHAGGVDLAKMSPAEIGEAVRNGVLGMTVTRMTEARRKPALTTEQLRKVVALVENLGLTRDLAVKVVLR